MYSTTILLQPNHNRNLHAAHEGRNKAGIGPPHQGANWARTLKRPSQSGNMNGHKQYWGRNKKNTLGRARPPPHQPSVKHGRPPKLFAKRATPHACCQSRGVENRLHTAYTAGWRGTVQQFLHVQSLGLNSMANTVVSMPAVHFRR